MEYAGAAAFLAAGLLVASLFVRSPDAKRNIRFAAGGVLLAAGVWLALWGFVVIS